VPSVAGKEKRDSYAGEKTLAKEEEGLGELAFHRGGEEKVKGPVLKREESPLGRSFRGQEEGVRDTLVYSIDKKGKKKKDSTQLDLEKRKDILPSRSKPENYFSRTKAPSQKRGSSAQR